MFNQKYTANAGHASAGTTKSSFSEIRPVAWALFLHVTAAEAECLSDWKSSFSEIRLVSWALFLHFTAAEAECLSDWSIEHSEIRGTSASVGKSPVARWSRGMILA